MGEGQRRQAAVIGDPIAHSLSPQLHSAAYRVLGAEIEYCRHQVPAGTGLDFVRTFQNQPQALGLSVTMPLKAELLAAADELSPRVQSLGALNTLYRVSTGDGENLWRAENTDVDGIIRALTARTTLGRGPWAILGAGNTAVAALAAAKEAQATAITVIVREPQRAAKLCALAEQLGLASSVYALAEADAELLYGHTAVISTLPAHAADHFATRLAPGSLALPPLLDVAYDPWPSALAEAFARGGAEVVSGQEMLLYQAVEQVQLFTGAAPFTSAVRQQLVGAMCDAIGLRRPTAAG